MGIKLFDYQQKQVNQYLSNGNNLNKSETGVGKTYIALESFKQSKATKLLVICLAGKVDDFSSDGKNVGLNITPLNKGTKKNKVLLEQAEHASISFESSWRLEELVQWVDTQTFILIDEAHKVNSRSSKVSHFVEKLSDRTNYVYAASATFIANGKYEQYYQLLKITNNYTGSWKEFEKRYCITELQEMKLKTGTRYFNQIVGYQNTEELDQLVISKSLFAQRDIDNDKLPEDIFYTVKKPAMYNKIRKEKAVTLPNGEIIEYDSVSKLYHGLRQLSSGVLKGVEGTIKKEKQERLQTILEGAENSRVVVFFNYKAEKASLIELMDKLGRPYGVYDGDTKNLSPFRANSNGVALVQYQSGATGLNDFVISNIAVFYSVPNSSTTYIQAKGRINRYGQKKKPLYYHIFCEKSVESELFEKGIQQGLDLKESETISLLNITLD